MSMSTLVASLISATAVTPSYERRVSGVQPGGAKLSTCTTPRSHKAYRAVWCNG
jgi:hypothetical protein